MSLTRMLKTADGRFQISIKHVVDELTDSSNTEYYGEATRDPDLDRVAYDRNEAVLWLAGKAYKKCGTVAIPVIELTEWRKRNDEEDCDEWSDYLAAGRRSREVRWMQVCDDAGLTPKTFFSADTYAQAVPEMGALGEALAKAAEAELWLKMAASYIDQAQRLGRYWNGDWHFMGVKATVFFNGVELCDDSLWGIESDSGEDCFKEVERDVCAEALDQAKTELQALAKSLDELRGLGSDRDIEVPGLDEFVAVR